MSRPSYLHGNAIGCTTFFARRFSGSKPKPLTT